MPLDIPLGVESAADSISIDGKTYRPLLVDASGRLYVLGIGTGGAIEVVQDTPADLKAAVHGLDGATQRQLVVDSSGRLLAVVRDLPFALRTAVIDQTVAVTTDVDIVTFASGKRARIIACALSGRVCGYEDITVQLYTYDSVGASAIASYHYSATIAELRNLDGPFYDPSTAFVPNIYHVYRYVSASDWNMRILCAPHARADYGFGIRLINLTAANRRFLCSVIYELEL